MSASSRSAGEPLFNMSCVLARHEPRRAGREIGRADLAGFFEAGAALHGVPAGGIDAQAGVKRVPPDQLLNASRFDVDLIKPAGSRANRVEERRAAVQPNRLGRLRSNRRESSLRQDVEVIGQTTRHPGAKVVSKEIELPGLGVVVREEHPVAGGRPGPQAHDARFSSKPGCLAGCRVDDRQARRQPVAKMNLRRDPHSIRRPGGSEMIGQIMRQLPRFAAFDIDHEDLQASIVEIAASVVLVVAAASDAGDGSGSAWSGARWIDKRGIRLAYAVRRPGEIADWPAVTNCFAGFSAVHWQNENALVRRAIGNEGDLPAIRGPASAVVFLAAPG